MTGRRQPSSSDKTVSSERYRGAWHDGLRHGWGRLDSLEGDAFGLGDDENNEGADDDNEDYDETEDRNSGQNPSSPNDLAAAIVLRAVIAVAGTSTSTSSWYLTYVGEWVSDQPHGFGTLTYGSHSRAQLYEGQWEADVKHGKGAVFLATGEVVRGVWIQGGLHNPVDFTFAPDARWNEPTL